MNNLKLACLIHSAFFLTTFLAPYSHAQNSIANANTLTNNHLTIYKNPNCGCCSKWAQQLKFSNTSVAVNQLHKIKAKYNVPKKLRACHTAITKSGFVFEGHIPNAAIQAFLAQPVKGAYGLSVPGMPIGSPGMEVGDNTIRYPIYLLKKDSSVGIYKYAIGKSLVDS
jgi:hypothetical protein